MSCRVFLLLLLLSAAVFGQITGASPSLTVTATLGQNVPPDQVQFNVVIQSGPAATLDDVMGALQGTALTPANFSGVSSTNQYVVTGNPANQSLDWSFQLAVPLANLKSQVAALQALGASLSQGQVPLTLSYSVQGPQASSQAQVQSCSLPDLVSAARAKAQQIAGAANRNAGAIAALSSSVSTMIGPSAVMPYIIPACSLTVTFGPAQPAGNTITVAASRTINVPPDLVDVVAYVTTPAASALNDALAALSGTGFTAANLVNVYANSQSVPSPLQWQFSMAVPFSKMKDTLAALQKTAAQTVSFWVQGTQLSPQLVAAQDCSYASLLGDAQAQARQVTAAAGVALNSLVSISDGSLATQVRSGDFSQIITGVLVSNPFVVPYTAPATCGVVAQFGIGQ